MARQTKSEASRGAESLAAQGVSGGTAVAPIAPRVSRQKAATARRHFVAAGAVKDKSA